MSSSVILEAEGLRKVFSVRGAQGAREDFHAVDNVGFRLARGASLGIVGESGSGKTTVARMVAGLETPTAGMLAFDGQPLHASRSVRGRRERARRIQMVFQDPFGSLDPRQTLGAALNELLSIHFSLDGPAQRARITELFDQVGLDEKHLSTVPRDLSGGQRQRFAIARALAMEPELLILDEAVSALDVSVQAQILNLLSDLREQLGISYLFVSHDLAVVRQVTTDCIVMRRGVVVEAGLTAAILDAPRADYTRRLLAAVPRPGWKPERQPRSG